MGGPAGVQMHTMVATRLSIWLASLCCLLLLAVGLPCVRADDASPGGDATLRLARDPLDAEARLALADQLEKRGKTGSARRHLRAFLRLIPRHPRRVEIARRVASLLPKDPWVEVNDRREDGGYLLHENCVDGSQAVRIPGGTYRRHLAPRHAADDDTKLDVRFDVHVDAFRMDLHETPRITWMWFLMESGFAVQPYWGEDAADYLATREKSTALDWTWLQGTFSKPDHPIWPLSWHEARALARSAGKRLPTEAEWEKAARGGVELDADGMVANPHPERPYPWGSANPDGPHGVLANAAGTGVDSRSSDEDCSLRIDTMPRGASPYGCLHMLGNVQEWCADWYWPDELVMLFPPRNPVAPHGSPGGAKTRVKVTKGGYFNWSASSLSIDERTRHTHDIWSMALLFKCGLRGASDANADPDDPKYGADRPEVDVPRNDPLDGLSYLDQAVRLREKDARRAWRHARAAARLLRSGPGRERALDMVAALRPTNPAQVWERLDDGRYRNRIDGGLAVLVGDVLADVHEVTEGQYLAFLAETARTPDDVLGVNPQRLGNGDMPAATLSHAEATRYAAWAGKRLPTRAEWLRLAHAQEGAYPWGAESPAGRARVEDSLDDRLREVWDRRAPVGTYRSGATPEGLLDLVGNVAEWCADGPKDSPPDYEENYLLGGDIRSEDVDSPESWRESLERARGPDPDLHRHMCVGARCVGPAPTR